MMKIVSKLLTQLTFLALEAIETRCLKMAQFIVE